MILDLGATPFGNGSLFTEIKENSPLINNFGPMCIDFDYYPPYNDAISNFSEVNINAHVQCCYVYPYSTPKDIIITCINKKRW